MHIEIIFLFFLFLLLLLLNKLWILYLKPAAYLFGVWCLEPHIDCQLQTMHFHPISHEIHFMNNVEHSIFYFAISFIIAFTILPSTNLLKNKKIIIIKREEKKTKNEDKFNAFSDMFLSHCNFMYYMHHIQQH